MDQKDRPKPKKSDLNLIGPSVPPIGIDLEASLGSNVLQEGFLEITFQGKQTNFRF